MAARAADDTLIPGPGGACYVNCTNGAWAFCVEQARA